MAHCLCRYIKEQTEFQYWIKDNYINIIWKNLPKNWISQYVIQNGSYTFDVPYDAKSVMHYFEWHPEGLPIIVIEPKVYVITIYSTHAIITHGLYIFYSIFQCVYNQECLILQTS